MSDLHGVCVLGIVSIEHTVTIEADLIIITRGYKVEVKFTLPPPEKA